MLCLVVLSLNATFASDDDSTIADDGIVDDESLAISDEEVLSADADVVTKDNFNQYFDESGALRANFTGDNLTFKDDISNVGVKTISFNRTITITGDNATLTNISIDVKANNIVIKNLTINVNNATSAISIVNKTGVEIENTKINFNAIAGSDGVAIDANLADNLKLIANTINYVGATTGSEYNSGIRIVNSNNTEIKGNKFNLKIASAGVHWEEIPPGSKNWVGFVVSDGIFIDSSDNVTFDANQINATYNSIVGYYDTIYTVRIVTSNNATVTNNNITGSGHTYIYGIIVSGDDIEIEENNINITSDNNYANGIDIEGSKNILIKNNTINTKSPISAYPIYTGMTYGQINAEYNNNKLFGEAYYVIGMSLADNQSHIEDNIININGNYTLGIASNNANLIIVGNNITAISSQMGNLTISDSHGVDPAGIKVVNGTASFYSNKISTSGKGISVKNNNAYMYYNIIDVEAIIDKDAYAIYADSPIAIVVSNNNITYVGKTNGTGINNALLIENANVTRVYENNFNITLVSSYVPWAEVPAGSGNWISSPISEGIVIKTSNNATFEDNNVTVKYGGVVGSYDTIYAVDFNNCDNLTASGNNIAANGHSYIYGIIVSGDDIEIEENNINITSDNNYANGIDIEGSKNILIKNNTINTKSPISAYPIYTGMTYGQINAEYNNNKLFGEAYYVIGMSLADNQSHIEDNIININGNYTLGIASNNANLIIVGNNITAISSQIGNLSIGDSHGVDPAGIKVVNGTVSFYSNKISTSGKGISVKNNNAYMYYNIIDVEAIIDKDAYAIYADSPIAIVVSNNNITYVGKTNGTGINIALLIENANVTRVYENNFNITLVSSYVPWAEIPSGSGNYVSSPVSEGIVIKSSNNATFEDNNVIVKYDGISGSYDTIYAVDFNNCDNLTANDNNITANGHTYIYGIIVSGNNFKIVNNTINTASDNYYANGIDVEGPATGIIKDNIIIANAPSSSYPIYAAMSNGDVSAEIVNNTISGEAYFVCALEVSGKEMTIANNTIDAKGNYTIGVGSKAGQLTVANNNISLNASNKGNVSIWDSIGAETAGIKVLSGSVAIADNNVTGTDKAIKLAGTNITIKADNQIKGHNAADLFKATFYGLDGKVLANQNVTLTVGATEYKLVTDANGVATLNAALGVGTYDVVAYNPVTNETATYSLTIVSRFSGNANVVMDYYDGTAYKVLVYGDDGNPVAGASVTITIKGKSYNVVTDASGYASYVVTELPGTYTISATYAGDSVSNSVQVKQILKAYKKTTTIKKSKTKKFTLKATLKTTAKKAISGKKVTFKLNGKKYTAKTNKKGVVSVTIKKSAIKKLKAKKKYTVTVTYVKDVVKCYVKVNK